MCEDYRAGATYDDELDTKDVSTGRKISCPIHAIWSGPGELGRWFDVLEVWRRWSSAEMSGRALDAGHFLAEEAPEATLAELRSFLGR
jgi:haloacetate dehalogenase